MQSKIVGCIEKNKDKITKQKVDGDRGKGNGPIHTCWSFSFQLSWKWDPILLHFFYSLIWFHCVSTQLISTAMFDSLLCPSSLLIKAHKQTHARSQSHFSFHEHRSLEASAKLFHPPRFLRPLFCYLPFAVCFS